MSPDPRRLRAAWLVGNTAFAIVSLAVGVAWAWPIYQNVHFLVMSAAAVGCAVALAVVGAIWRIRGWLLAAIGGLFLLVMGVPLAIPDDASGGFLPTLAGIRLFVIGVWESWRQLVTVPTLPVGSYQGLLIPAFLTLFVTALLGLSVALRGGRWGSGGALIVGLSHVFGAAFGWAVGTSVEISGLVIPQSSQLAWGVVGFATTLLWLAWRVAYDRRRRLAAFARAAPRRAAVTALRGAASAGVMLGVALLVGGAVSLSSADNSRTVLRSEVQPVLDLTSWSSPLSSYRSYFADGSYDSVLFTVSGLSGASDDDRRVRLAVLDSYDGVTFHVGEQGAADSDRYQLLPGARQVSTVGTTVNLDVTIASYGGVWMPSVGDATSVTFPADTQLSNSVYIGMRTGNVINAASRGSGVTGVGPGDAYTYSGVRAATSPGSSALGGVARVTVDDVSYPQLRQWRTAIEKAGYRLDTLAGARAAITLLTDSGYLSHGVDVGAASAQNGSAPEWAQQVPRAISSRAGHSRERIESLFSDLNKNASGLPRAGSRGAPVVSAVGDDEQFATAAALLVQSAGYDARVVLGAEPEDDGTVRGKDVRAWVEVMLADGTWADISATPQSTTIPQVVSVEKKTQEVPTTVDPVQPSVEPPSQADPAAHDDGQAEPPAPSAQEGWLLPAFRFVGIGLLLVLALVTVPVTIVALKRSRARERRARSDPRAAILGGWDEWVDRLADIGVDIAVTDTRREVGARVGAPAPLWQAADRAAFSSDPAKEYDASAYWLQVEAEIGRLQEGNTRWARLKSALNPASFLRRIRMAKVVGAATKRSHERG